MMYGSCSNKSYRTFPWIANLKLLLMSTRQFYSPCVGSQSSPQCIPFIHFPSASSTEQISMSSPFHVLYGYGPTPLFEIVKWYHPAESEEEGLHSGWLQHPKGSVIICTKGGTSSSEGNIDKRYCYASLHSHWQPPVTTWTVWKVSWVFDDNSGNEMMKTLEYPIQWLQVWNRCLKQRTFFRGRLFILRKSW